MNGNASISFHQKPSITSNDLSGAQGSVSLLAIAGLVFSILIPPVGLIISIITLTIVRKKAASSKILAILGIVIGATLSLPVIFYGTLYLLFLNAHFTF